MEEERPPLPQQLCGEGDGSGPTSGLWPFCTQSLFYGSNPILSTSLPSASSTRGLNRHPCSFRTLRSSELDCLVTTICYHRRRFSESVRVGDAMATLHAHVGTASVSFATAHSSFRRQVTPLSMRSVVVKGAILLRYSTSTRQITTPLDTEATTITTNEDVQP